MVDNIRNFVRKLMMHIAGFLDYSTKGRLKPSHVTTISLLGHFPVAWALVYCKPVLAGVLLAFFALLDALDGALARVQNSSSRTGMFFDSVSDRMKEIIVFSALAVFVYKHIDITQTWQVVAVAGTSILVSFVRAKGEAALAKSKKQPEKLNTVFALGFATYEIRVIAVVIGLLFGWIAYVLPLMIAANCITVASRFIAVSRELYILDRDEIDQKKAKKPTPKKAHDKS